MMNGVTLKRLKTIDFMILVGLVMPLLVGACGGGSDPEVTIPDPGPLTTCEPNCPPLPPQATPTPPPDPSDNLALFAYASSSSDAWFNAGGGSSNDDFLHKKEFINNNSTAQAFISEEAGSSEITLKFNSVVRIESIFLYDIKNSQTLTLDLLAGEFEFFNSEANPIIATLDFGDGSLSGLPAPPADGSSPLTISGQLQNVEVDELTLSFLDFKDEASSGPDDFRVGLAELAIVGTRVDPDIALSNVSKFTRFTSNNGPLHDNESKFGIANVKDDQSGAANCSDLTGSKRGFVTDGAGGNLKVNAEFDIKYAVEEVVIYDRHADPNVSGNPAQVKKVQLTFDDNSKTNPVAINGSSHCVVIDLTDEDVYPDGGGNAKKTKSIAIAVAGPKGVGWEEGDNDNKDTGFAEIEIFGSYTQSK